MTGPTRAVRAAQIGGRAVQPSNAGKAPAAPRVAGRVAVRPQTSLRVSSPADPYEREADRVADRVMRMAAGDAVMRACACDDEVQRSTWSGAGAGHPGRSDAGVVARAAVTPTDGGRPLDGRTLAWAEGALAHDFSDVRIHTSGTGASAAESIAARAYTLGRRIVFGAGQYRPDTPGGRRLLVHELTHVIQQGGAGGEQSHIHGSIHADQQGNVVHRQITPEDVSGQMVGQIMTTTADFNAPSFVVIAGDSVEILSWSNSSTTANVQLLSPHLNAFVPFDIPKTLLRPIRGTSGLDQYDSGLDTTVTDIARGDARIAAERARPGGPRPGEIPRLEGLQQNRQRTLNRRLIQETMYNRFDASIAHWVSFYNATFSASGFGDLNANLVKSMLFQESEMGTSGRFMSVTPGNREMGIHNLGQVIDSSASALLMLMRESEPSLITTYHLQNIARDTNNRPAGVAAEDFMWGYVAAGETQGFQDAVDDFYATAGGAMRDTSYDFWIQAAVRWLFEKRRSVSSWSEAIRAYNGGGASARRYRDAVLRRAARAAAATAAGTSFVPTR